jgi:hypothetical protein
MELGVRWRRKAVARLLSGKTPDCSARREEQRRHTMEVKVLLRHGLPTVCCCLVGNGAVCR